MAVPELALIDVDPEIGRREPDEEVQALVTASAGLNLAVDFLPGSVGYDRSFVVPSEDAARVLWLDGFVANVDRSARNTNLLIWHKNLWAIDHGACLRFHHAWGSPDSFATAAYNYGDHVLTGKADPRRVHEELTPLVTAEALEMIMESVPGEWLEPDPTRPDPAAPADAADRPAGLLRLPARPAARGGELAAVTLMAFQYAVVRAVPRIDRGEMINIGVIMYCQQADFLRASMIIDDVRLRALDAEVDLEAVQTAAQAIVEACAEHHGSARENDGLAARFGMVTAPRSTVVQPSLIHAGVTRNPQRTLVDLDPVAPVGDLKAPRRRLRRRPGSARTTAALGRTTDWLPGSAWSPPRAAPSCSPP